MKKSAIGLPLNYRIKVVSARDVLETFDALKGDVTTTILDPWYNKGIGGTRNDYNEWLKIVVKKAAQCSQHVFIWGFPEIVCHVLNDLPPQFNLVAWLTWYYKNCPSVIRGWRSAQYTCIHISKNCTKLYPEHFLNEVQLERQRQGKLRYLPGPPTVLEVPLNIGFVGKKEQTGHPAQKPEKVIIPLILMSTKENDIVLDPMCGAGTTGMVCKRLRRRAILCDNSAQWVEITRKRLKKLSRGIDNHE